MFAERRISQNVSPSLSDAYLYMRLASGHGNDSDAFHVTCDRL